MKDYYIDLHCHPALKPFGKSYNRKPIGKNNPHRSKTNSIWKYNPPSIGDKLVNILTGITKFSQSNFSSLAKGQVNIVCASLYPMEKKFFLNEIKNEFFQDVLANFVTGIGKKRIDAVQAMKDYFKDLEMEYDFYKQLDGKVIHLPEGSFRYKLVKNYTEINTIKNKKKDTALTTICVIVTIEGMHVLNSDIDKKPKETDFIANLKKIKNWETPPFFVTMAHHFWNHLCGHAESFSGKVKKCVDQKEGINTGFTELGRKVARLLLDNSNGKRILIDIKHMSVTARKEYYKILDDDPSIGGIPIIISHGAANGMRSSSLKTQNGSEVAKKLNPVDINFFDDEIIRVAKSKGIFGLQLDERRVASKKTLKKTKRSIHRSKIMHYRSELLWNQIQHILEVLDKEGLFAWDCIALGTDYDGIIDPLNSFWTSEELPYLADFLERHAYNYMSDSGFVVKENNIKADEIVARFMYQNAESFLKKHFK